MGYNNQDFYSPEMYFGVAEADLAPYLLAVNDLLIMKNQQLYQLADLKGEMNQLKVFIDLCHIYRIGVIFDQVFNHAGGGFDDDDSLYFMDRQNADSNDNSLYFTSTGYSGGLVFDYTQPEVRDFLINNCKYFIEEYKVDGFVLTRSVP